MTNTPMTRKGFAPGTIFTVFGFAVQAEDRKIHGIETTYRKLDGSGMGSKNLGSRVLCLTFRTMAAASAWSGEQNRIEGDSKCIMVPINS